MSEQSRRALRALEGHLAEVMDMDEAAEIVDRLDRTVSEDYLDRALAQQWESVERLISSQTSQMAAMWRRDLLLVTGAQFFALAAAVAALVGLA